MANNDLSLEDLARPPITSDFNPPYMSKNIVSYWSPNKKFRLVVSHCHEATMMNYLCIFSLLDKENEVIETFEPYWMPERQPVVWSSDSTKLLVVTRVSYWFDNVSYVNDVAIIYDVPARTFSWTRLSSFYDRVGFFKPSGICVIDKETKTSDSIKSDKKEINPDKLVQYPSSDIGIIRDELSKQIETRRPNVEGSQVRNRGLSWIRNWIRRLWFMSA